MILLWLLFRFRILRKKRIENLAFESCISQIQTSRVVSRIASTVNTSKWMIRFATLATSVYVYDKNVLRYVRLFLLPPRISGHVSALSYVSAN